MRRYQTATYWKSTGERDSFGNPIFESPRIVQVRWEDRSELFYDSDGRERRSQSRVGVGEDMSIGDYIQLGSHTAESTPPSGAKEVKDFRNTPDLFAKKHDRWAIV